MSMKAKTSMSMSMCKNIEAHQNQLSECLVAMRASESGVGERAPHVEEVGVAEST